ncbi:MAG: phage tail tape measure protein [Candidatus Bathyarchaeota archaeon]|nr:phage tail tape measure protein [Candidatus Bathyarchaeota archaeon]
MGGAAASVKKFKLGVVAATAAVAALSIAVAFKAVKSAAAFEQAMAKVKAISGAVGKEFKALEDRAKELGKVTKFTMVEIADGMEVLARAGFEVNEILSSMAGVTALASSQTITLAEAGKMVATALRGMGLDITETERAVNLFAATAASAALNVHELSESFKMIAPIADILGISIEQVAAMIAAIGQVGIVGTQATASLRTAFIRLADPIEGAQEWLDRLKITLWDVQGNFVGLGPMIGMMEKAFQNLGRQEQIAAIGAIFNVRSSTQLLALIKKGEEGFNKYVDSITNTTKAYEQQRIMLDTLSSRWIILQSSIDLLFLTLGTPSLDTLKAFTTAMTDVVNTITEWKEITNAAAEEIAKAGDEAEDAEKKIVSLNDYILELSGGMVNLKGVVYGVMNAVKFIWDFFGGYVIAIIKSWLSSLVLVVKLLQGDWKGAWNAAMRGLGAWANYYRNIFDDLGLVLTDWIDSIKDWFSNLWDHIRSGLRSFANFFIGQFRWIITQLNKILPSWAELGLPELLPEPPAKPEPPPAAPGPFLGTLTGLTPGGGLSIGGLGQETFAGFRLFDDSLGFATKQIDIFAQIMAGLSNVVIEITRGISGFELAVQKLTPTAVAADPLKAAEMLKDFGERDIMAAAAYTQLLIQSIEEEISARALMGEDVTEAKERLKQFNDALGNTTKTLADTLSGLWSPLRSVLGKLPGLMGDVTKGLVDLAKGVVMGDISGIITSIFNMITAWIQDEIKKLEARLDELRDILSFYTSTFKQISSMLSSAISNLLGPLGTTLAGVIQLLTTSIEMLTLDGIDLLRVGMTSLIGFVGTLIGTFSDLIQRSDAYGALQEESESVWKALGDVLGQFLWPLVAAIKYLKEWLGIQSDVNEQMAEIGVPTSWKRERRAYEAAAPGRIVTGGVEIPSWAEVLGQKLGETIKNILEGFGITSWTDLLAGAREWAERLWTWVTTELPGWINQVVTFLGNVWSAITAVYNWAVSNLGDLGDLGDVWDNFATALDNLPTWENVVSEIDKVVGAIEDLKDTLKLAMFMAAGAMIGGIAAALAASNPFMAWAIPGAAIAGALIGTGLGAVLAGSFDKGGIIPGPLGSRQIVSALAGEEIRTRAQQGQTIINEISVFIGGRELDDVVVESVQRRGKSATGHRSTTAGLTRRY